MIENVVLAQTTVSHLESVQGDEEVLLVMVLVDPRENVRQPKIVGSEVVVRVTELALPRQTFFTRYVEPAMATLFEATHASVS